MEHNEHTLWVNKSEAVLVEENLAKGVCYPYYTATLIGDNILEVEITKGVVQDKPTVKLTLSDELGIPQAYKSFDSHENVNFFSGNSKYAIKADNREINFSLKLMSLEDIVEKLPVIIKKTENGQPVDLIFNNLKDFQQFATDVLKPEELIQKRDFTIGGKLYNDINFIEFYADVRQEIAHYKKIENFLAKREQNRIVAKERNSSPISKRKNNVSRGR